MTRVVRRVEAFQLNGWTIKPCDTDGFDLVHGDERYHHDELGAAVRAAQSSSRPTRTEQMLNDNQIDLIRMAQLWCEQMDRSSMPESRARRVMVQRLLDRIERYEKNMPSWSKGTPEEYDRWLAKLTPEDRRLEFYRWIGAKAVGEAVRELRKQVADDPVPVEHQHWDAGLVDELLDAVDPSQENYDPFPSAMPLNSLRCNNPDHIHINGGSYRASCIVDLEAWS
jgi:hypothetical protein